MESIHDLGGKQGFGQVRVQPDEPVFHERWEAQVFACMIAATRHVPGYNVDRFRHAIERIDPICYLMHGYYGRWLGGIENLLVEAGLLSSEELSSLTQMRGGSAQDRIAARPAPDPDPQGPEPADAGARRPLSKLPLFRVGEAVRTSPYPTLGHSRLPAYARGKTGLIVAWHNGWVYPDSNAHGLGEDPQHLYTVAFAGGDLWGPEAEAGVRVQLDLFEPYLEPGETAA